MIFPANENRTKIYRIRRKVDRKFLATCPREYSPTVLLQHNSNWNDVGIFWKKPETIRKHLFDLCCFRVWEYNDLSERHPTMGYSPLNYKTKTRHVRTVLEWLDLYEVVATDITVHGTHTMNATDFASFQPIEGTGFERVIR